MPHKILSNLKLMNNIDYLITNGPVLYYNFIFWYFEQLHTHLYQGCIRTALYEVSQVVELEWSSYLKLFDWNSLREEVYPAMVQNNFVVVMIVVYLIVLCSYLLNKIFKISFFDKKFVPEIYNILAFYLFLIIPFKNSHFFSLINRHLHSTSFFPSFVKSTDMLYFLVVVPASYLCLCAISRLKRRTDKLGILTNRICNIFRTTKSTLIFSFVLCYSLRVVFAVRDDLTIGLVVLIVIAFQKSKTIYNEDAFTQKILFLCRKLLCFIENFFFLFCNQIVKKFFSYILVFVLLHLLTSMLFLPSNFILWIDIVLDNIFSSEMTLFSVSLKLVMFCDFINLGNEKIKEA